jgi:transcriptional regulator PpsR
MNHSSRHAADLTALSDCAAELAEVMVSLASDIALVIDDDGVIRSVAQSGAAPLAPGMERWVGRAWADTVTGDTRRKIELMLTDLNLTGVARRREVNVSGASGTIPLAYTAMRLGHGGPVIAVGRDLRAVAAIQQRFLDAQQDLERSYWRARQLESRYRLLFQVATDAVMTVEATSLRIVEANHAAAACFGRGGAALAGQGAVAGFEPASRPAVQALLDSARASGRPAEIPARLAGGGPVAVSATPFRARDGMRLLLRVRHAEPAGAGSPELAIALARLVDTTRDGVAVTDSAGRIQVANPAFVTLVGAASEDQVRGRAIADWLGRIDSDVPTLIAGVHGHGIAELVRTQLRREGGQGAIEVDVAAALLTEGDQECFGFTLRPCGSAADAAAERRRTRLASALAVLEGALAAEAPASGLLREAQRIVQRHFVALALERSGGDAEAAAALLGMNATELVQLRDDGGSGG